MKSLYHSLHDKYSDHASIYNSDRNKNIVYANESSFMQTLNLANDETKEFLLLKYKRLMDRFIYGNSFVGNELFMIKYVLYQITIWNSIAANEEIDDSKLLMCGNEIQILFYNFLNIVYNLKEKVQKFVLFDKGKSKKDSISILTEDSKKKLSELFNKEYKNINILCEARRYLVHDSFAMHYDKSKQAVTFSAMDFDLSTKNIYEKENYLHHFSLKENDLNEHLSSIERMVYGLVDVLSDFNSIDANLFAEKFTITENGKKIIRITF